MMKVHKNGRVVAGLLTALLGAAAWLPAGADQLPQTAPQPVPRSEAIPEAAKPAEQPAAAPLPDQRPAVPTAVATPAAPYGTPSPRPKSKGEEQGPPATAAGKAGMLPATPGQAPLPAQPPGAAGGAAPAAEPAPLEIPPRPEVSPAEEVACRERLTAMGAEFADAKPLSDPSGCSVPQPLSLKTLAHSIAVEPPVVVDCAIAEAVARFATGTVSKLAETELGSPLKSLQQASGYVCRPRNGTRKLSEHAFGNALDIASFTLADGTVVAVTATDNPKQAAFLSKLRAAACGPFKTVLGPGSDADHASHFHLDLAKRRTDKPFCQ